MCGAGCALPACSCGSGPAAPWLSETRAAVCAVLLRGSRLLPRSRHRFATTRGLMFISPSLVPPPPFSLLTGSGCVESKRQTVRTNRTRFHGRENRYMCFRTVRLALKRCLRAVRCWEPWRTLCSDPARRAVTGQTGWERLALMPRLQPPAWFTMAPNNNLLVNWDEAVTFLLAKHH